MPTLYEQRNLSMTPDHWLALEAAAVQTNSRSTRGPQARQHSWRCLIERIAKGEFELVEKNPYPIEQTLIEAADRLEAEQRAEYERDKAAQAERVIERAAQLVREQEQTRKTPAVKLAQLDMFPEPA